MEVSNFLIPMTRLSLRQMTKTDSWFYWEVILSYCCKAGAEKVVIIYMNTDISIFLHYHSKHERIYKEDVPFIKGVFKIQLI